MTRADVITQVPQESTNLIEKPTPAPERERPVPLFARVKLDVVRAFLSSWVRCFSMKGLYWLGQFFGTCEYVCDYNRRRRVRAKLQQIFPDGLTKRQRRLFTWRYFCRIRCDKMLYLILDRVPRDKLLNRIR